MCSLVQIVLMILDLYSWVIIISAILSWLVAFNVVNPHNQVVNTIGRALYGLTEPLLQPIRRYMPDLGGVDISPVVLLIAIYAVRLIIVNNLLVPACS